VGDSMDFGDDVRPAPREIEQGPAESPSPVDRAARRARRQALREARESVPSKERMDLFRGLDNLDRADDLFENAKKLADRVDIEQCALDFLYRHSRWNCSSQAAWEHEIKTAFAIEQIITSFFRGGSLSETWIDRNAEIDAFKKLQSANGTLILASHAGFVKITQKLFTKNIRESKDGSGFMLRGRRKPGEALFIALRALQDGGTVFMAPDGHRGKQSATFNVLGKTIQGGDGAAFLAHSSNCHTAWYTTHREGERFVPVVELGPQRAEREPFAEFKKRLHDFYCEKLEQTFTGNPRNIVLRQRWISVFGKDNENE